MHHYELLLTKALGDPMGQLSDKSCFVLTVALRMLHFNSYKLFGRRCETPTLCICQHRPEMYCCLKHQATYKRLCDSNPIYLPPQAGVNASSEQVLEWLVRADTASAFNISLGDVSVTGVQQVSTT